MDTHNDIRAMTPGEAKAWAKANPPAHHKTVVMDGVVLKGGELSKCSKPAKQQTHAPGPWSEGLKDLPSEAREPRPVLWKDDLPPKPRRKGSTPDHHNAKRLRKHAAKRTAPTQEVLLIGR